MSTHRLDVPALYRALDARRTLHGLSWRDVAAEVDVSPSTFSRLADGRCPDADALSSLIVWLGLSLRQFVRQGDDA